MSTHLSWPLRGAFGFAIAALSCSVLFAANARASVPVDLRVVASNGEVLADLTQYTDTTKVKTDRKADCLGTGGSGDTVTIKGSTALGAVIDGASYGDPGLNPLSISDGSDFGLGVCGIGGEVAPSTGFWFLKHNREASMSGGESTKVREGDEVTWYLDPDFADAPPLELELVAPARTTFETPTEVRVFEYDDTGARVPAAGVTVTGASAATDATGRTTVSLTNAGSELEATRAGAITDSAGICVRAEIGDCPKEPGTNIGGSRDDDVVEDGDGGDSISMGAGDDRANTRDGFADDVSCGSGKDTVKADREDEIANNCEKVRD
jgi:hypothetical protein